VTVGFGYSGDNLFGLGLGLGLGWVITYETWVKLGYKLENPT
jgi:hypothetical protein